MALRWIFAGCVGIVLFDAAAALASDAFDFDYGALWPVSLAIYALTGFAAARASGSLRTGGVGGAAVAATDATLGWAISWAIGPGAPDPGDRDAVIVAGTGLIVAVSGAVLGFLGGLIGRRVGTA